MARDPKHPVELLLSAARAFQQTHWEPSVDAYRTARGWLLKYELAGVQPDEVQLSISGRRISDYLASELRGQLLHRSVRVDVTDKLARGSCDSSHACRTAPVPR